MTIQEIEKIHRQATQYIDDARVKDAFEQINRLATELGRADINDELERLRISYDFMLRYLSDGVMDPQRDEILTGIRQSLYMMNDLCQMGLKEAVSAEVFYVRRRDLGSVSLVSIVEEYRSSLKELSLLQSLPADQSDSHAILSCLHQTENLETRLFNRV